MDLWLEKTGAVILLLKRIKSKNRSPATSERKFIDGCLFIKIARLQYRVRERWLVRGVWIVLSFQTKTTVFAIDVTVGAPNVIQEVTRVKLNARLCGFDRHDPPTNRVLDPCNPSWFARSAVRDNKTVVIAA